MQLSEAEMAPVLVLAYMRPAHLRRTIESLQANAGASRTHVHIYCDAPKKQEHLEQVLAVRGYVTSITGFASVSTIFRDTNLGLARSVVTGVSELLRTHDRVIVIEDDLILSPDFLRYMNDGLRQYATASRVASIHGYCYPTGGRLPETFFLRGADCWGWATWARAWTHFEADGEHLLQQLRARGLTRDFDLDGTFPFTKMLQDQIAGRNDSWAIRWHASCYLKDLLTLYPGTSLVHNSGNDGTGTHGGTADGYNQPVSPSAVRVTALPLEPSPVARSAFKQFLRRQRSPLIRAKNLLRRIVQKAP